MHIPYQAVMSHFKDRRILVFINGHDHFRFFHAGYMLQRAGNGTGKVQFRCDGLTGLPYLGGMVYPLFVHSRAGSCNRRFFK